MKLGSLALALAAPLLLASCVLSPGKFVSSLHVGKDRSFTFTYAGEVILLDPGESMASGIAEGMAEGMAAAADGAEGEDSPPSPPPQPAKPAEPTAQQIAERKAVAEALAKEVGYRSVEYLGGNRFRVDYSLSGRLDRLFVFPVNVDAKQVIPWIAIEPRQDGTVRVKALAFGDPEEGMGSIAKPEKPEHERSGSFTLTTDASLVMQNNEEGLAPGPGTRVVWKVTPTSKTVPTAVIRF
jgi:hypothetical protein